MEDKYSILLEEYKISNTAYNNSFDEGFSVLKFYTSTILIVLGVIFVKDKAITITGHLKIYALTVLLIISILAVGHHFQSIKKKKKNIQRMNFIRNLLFSENLGPEILEKYNAITNYHVTNKAFITISVIGPIIFYLTASIVIVAMLLN